MDRLKAEVDRHVATACRRIRAGPERALRTHPLALQAHTLGALLDEDSPMPEDLIGPRLLTPGGMLVLGGAPKVGKSDFLISLLVHAAAGVRFLRFEPSRPLRVFYLQAEIQYHYLRERLRGMRIDPAVLAAARDTLVATPKLRHVARQDRCRDGERAIREPFRRVRRRTSSASTRSATCSTAGRRKAVKTTTAAMLFFLQSGSKRCAMRLLRKPG